MCERETREMHEKIPSAVITWKIQVQDKYQHDAQNSCD